MLSRDSEDKMWSRFVFELVIWLQEFTLARWTQPSGPLCLWQCFYKGNHLTHLWNMSDWIVHSQHLFGVGFLHFFIFLQSAFGDKATSSSFWQKVVKAHYPMSDDPALEKISILFTNATNAFPSLVFVSLTKSHCLVHWPFFHFCSEVRQASQRIHHVHIIPNIKLLNNIRA